jgi:UPF0755 protein
MKVKLLYIFTLAGIFTVALIINLAFFQRMFRTDPADITLKIKKGDNLRNIATELEEKQVIDNKTLFILTGRLLGYQGEIIPGEYTFRNGMTNLEILKKVTDPNSVRYFTVTIPEGMNIRQIGRLLQRQLGIDSARFVEASYNDSLINELGIDADNLEGYLFPDTYRISFSPSGKTEEKIVKMMVSNFMKKITPELKEEMEDEGLDLKEVVTMASIIEGETRYEPEKKTIAGVYYNRLRKHMKLEADPTVQYAIPDGPKPRLVYSDLKYPSPYNTYLHRGLPPGPINNPGLGSIIAAIEPEDNDYLYFVAKGDGSHRFAETYREHKENIQLYKEYLHEKEENNEK